MKDGQTIGQWLKWDFEANGSLAIKDKNFRSIYREFSNGWWAKTEYDLNGNEILQIDSTGFWVKREYNSQGNQIYYENSYGVIIDKRFPKSSNTTDANTN
jgi:hypothetical protein